MRRLSASLALTLLASANPLAAQGSLASQSWTMCTTTTIHSCGTFALSTGAVLTGPTRTGTAVSLRVTNLQGSLPAFDNTIWSIFPAITFLGHFPGMLGTASPQPLTPVLPGQTAEANSWAWQSGTVLDFAGMPMSMLQVYSPSLRSTIAGCDPVDTVLGPGSPSIYTCTSAQWATFSFESASIFDADQFQTARMEAEGVTSPAADDISLAQCTADPGAASQGVAPLGAREEACLVLAHTIVRPGDPGVVPEPATVSLLALGFAGLLVATRRKR